MDLTGLKTYTLAELERAVARNTELDGDHANHVGHGRYVIEYTPASCMNHSCDPTDTTHISRPPSRGSTAIVSGA